MNRTQLLQAMPALISTLAAPIPRKGAALAMIVGVLWAGPAAAWDLIVDGSIANFETYASGSSPGDFRVYIYGSGFSPCINGMTVIESDNTNYQAMVANLMTARAMGKPVEFRINIVGGICHLNDFVY